MQPRTEVVFLQHPRERNMPIGTCRMAHLGLVGSRLIDGIHFDDDPRIADLFDVDSGTAILFPGDDALPLPQWSTPPKKLVVLDGTWSQASKLLKENPRLASLPRMSFQPEQPGRYRIRKEPTDLHLSTIEAIAAVLGAIEGDVDGYQQLLRPFDHMVEWQLDQQRDHAVDDSGTRHTRRSARRHRDALKSDPLREMRPLLCSPRRIVVLYAEANAHPRTERADGVPELLHLVATRPFVDDEADVARDFEAVLKPRRPLHPQVAERLGFSDAQLQAGEDAVVAVARFRRWLDDARIACWGAFPRDLLVQEGEPKRGFIDVRAMTCRVLGAPAGGIEAGAAALGATTTTTATNTRGAQMLAAVREIVRALPTKAPAVDDRG